MCILFVKLLNSPKDGEYKLILASNRDEFFGRPSKMANFWKEDGNIYGGQDMTENKEGGTWLAMSKTGKIGVLLNCSGGKSDSEKKGRGFLVVDMLKDSNTVMNHLESLSQSSQDYNDFHLVAIDVNKNPGIYHYSNGNDANRITVLQQGSFGISNSPLDRPYVKVLKGKESFEQITGECNSLEKKSELVEQLLNLLKRNERHSDQVLDELSTAPQNIKQACSAVFIDIPSVPYGTRTHTIILVDKNGNTDFYEWTLKEPINPANKEWLKSHKSFKLST